MDSPSNKIIEATKELLKYFGYFVDNLWHVDDIHFICKQKNLPPISDSEAMEVFAIARDHFDGEFGISWPALDRAVRVYVQRKTFTSNIFRNTAA